MKLLVKFQLGKSIPVGSIVSFKGVPIGRVLSSNGDSDVVVAVKGDWASKNLPLSQEQQQESISSIEDDEQVPEISIKETDNPLIKKLKSAVLKNSLNKRAARIVKKKEAIAAFGEDIYS